MEALGEPASLLHTLGLRRGNAWHVLEALREGEAAGARSAPELASRTGLTRPTVDATLRLLQERGWVRRRGAGPSRGGRPAALFEPAAAGAFVVAVAFHIPEVVGLALDLRGREVARVAARTEAGASPGAALAVLADLLKRLLEAAEQALGAGSRRRLCACAAAVAGTLAPDRRVSRTLARLPGWREVPLAEELERRLDALGARAPVFLERYLNALGRALAGDGRGTVLCMEVSGGVGVALSSGFGAGGINAGEFGFTRLERDGPADATGRQGTVEAFLADAQVRRLAGVAGLPSSGTMEEVYHSLGGACAAGHPVARDLAVRYAQALANLGDLFAPEVLQVRGAAHAAGAAFQDAVARAFGVLALHACPIEWKERDPFEPTAALGRETLRRTLREMLFGTRTA